VRRAAEDSNRFALVGSFGDVRAACIGIPDPGHDTRRLSSTMGSVNRRRRKKLQRRLVAAAGWADVKQITGLLRAGADPNLPDAGGTRPLYRASVQNRADNVRALVAAGADPNLESGTGPDGLPLCGAACWGHLAAVRELLAGGADPNLREDNGQGRTATDWAGLGDHRHTLDLLLAAGGRR
jgi:ankyrin repeat protein